MTINYYSETDSVYIDFSNKESVSSKEVLKGVVIDFDSDGKIVGIDIDNAGEVINLDNLSDSTLVKEELKGFKNITGSIEE